MNLEIYDLDQTNLLNTVEILTIKEDADSLSGLDFYTTEAKTCKITFFEDDWTNNNLQNITYNDCIEDTNIIKMSLKFIRNSITKIYYMERDKIKYNKKDMKYTITAIDLFGLMLRMSEIEHNFADAQEDMVIADVVEEILNKDADIQYNIVDNIDYQGTAVEGFALPLQHDDYTSYLSGDPYVNNPNAYEFEALFKWVGLVDSDVYVYFYYVSFDNIDPYEEYYEKSQVYYIYKMADEYLAQLNYSSVFFDRSYSGVPSFPTTVAGHDIDDPVLNYDGGDFSYEIDGAELLYTGDVYFDNQDIKADDDGNKIYTYKNVIESMLLLNNIYIYSIGNNIYLGNKANLYEQGGDPISIAESDIIEYDRSYITFKEMDFKDKMDLFRFGDIYSIFLSTYYNTIRTEINSELKLIIVAEDDINILDKLIVYDEDLIVSEIHLDNDEFAYTIKAWSV